MNLQNILFLKSTMNILPNELTIMILSLLKLNDLKNMRLTSRDLNRLIKSIEYLDKVEVFRLKNIPFKLTNIKINPELSDDFPDIINLPDIKHLDLSKCVSFTKNGISSLKKLTHLETLNLTDCIEIVNDDLFYLKELNQLKILILKGCERISSGGIEQLKELNLDLLDVSYCLKIIRKFNFQHRFKKVIFDWFDQYTGITFSLPQYFD
jgi:hypothetical protein